ncbi:MAG: DUF5668 domain-containing protein [Melioribacteraceae bacterium]|nr:DUF5668 domain-containing protein [Melioribacteraceae bacterium]
MKSGQLFWGLFLLTIGALFLFTKYDVICSDFSFVWDLWPLIFVLWGAIVIFKNSLVRPIISALFGIFLAVLFFGIIANVFSGFGFSSSRPDRDFISENFSEQFDSSIQYANFELSSGAGTFELGKTTDKLVEGEAFGTLAEYDFSSDVEGNRAYVEFNLHKRHFNLFDGKLRNHLDIALNENPVWDFKLDFGAAKAIFDLSPYKVNNIDLNTGASNVKIKLGDRTDSTYIDVDMGVASLRIEIPENSGCQIKGDMVLMSRSLKGFTKKEKGFYETPDFDNAAKKIFIRIDGGVSSLKINRY